VNDLIGLKYGWGHSPRDGSGKTDCFQLACEVHERLGFGDYRAKFDWVYRDYTDETFPRRLIVRWLFENGKRLKERIPGAVVLLPGNAGSALATALNDSVLYISPGNNVVRSALPENIGHCFWMAK
jgi:hypothetical protein